MCSSPRLKDTDYNAASLWTFSPVAKVNVVVLLPSGVLPDNLVE